MPCLTFRVWVIGTVFSAAGVFIDVLFGYRNPGVFVGTNVGQLVACGFDSCFSMTGALMLFSIRRPRRQTDGQDPSGLALQAVR